MARSFNGSTDNLSVASNTILNSAGFSNAISMHCWVKTSRNAQQQAFIGKYDLATPGYLLYMESNGKAQYASPNGFVTGTILLSTGVWHAVGSRNPGGNAATSAVFVDGAAGGTGTTNNGPTNSSPLRIGAFGTSSLTSPLAGQVAEACVWQASLTDAEFGALAKGVSPLMIRPKSIIFYAPLWGAAAPEADLSGNASNLTVTGAVAADHGPVGRQFGFRAGCR